MVFLFRGSATSQSSENRISQLSESQISSRAAALAVKIWPILT